METNQTTLDGKKIKDQSHHLKLISFGVKIFDLFGFLISNIILFFVFEKFLPGNSFFQYIIFFLFALIIIKTEVLFELFDILINIRKIQIKVGWSQFKAQVKDFTIKTKLLVYSFFITLKQLFFNILYYLFPVLLIWATLAGILGLLGYISYSTLPSSYQVLAVLSIILGLFQYFLKRYEEKILIQINWFNRKILDIINEESSFEKFFSSIGNLPKEKALKNSIMRCVDPKLIATDFFSTIIENPNARRVLMRKKASLPIQLHMNYNESNKKFDLLDFSANSPQFDQNQLLIAYKNFFDEILENKIVLRIYEEIDIQAFGRLVFSNINIAYEVLPEFIKEGTNSFFDDILKKESTNVERNNSREFRAFLIKKIWKKIFSEITA